MYYVKLCNIFLLKNSKLKHNPKAIVSTCLFLHRFWIVFASFLDRFYIVFASILHRFCIVFGSFFCNFCIFFQGQKVRRANVQNNQFRKHLIFLPYACTMLIEPMHNVDWAYAQCWLSLWTMLTDQDQGIHEPADWSQETIDSRNITYLFKD